jgi:hypothetical protein
MASAAPCTCTESVPLCPRLVGTALRAGTSTSMRRDGLVRLGPRLAVCVETSAIYLKHCTRRIGPGVFDRKLIWRSHEM